LGVGWGYGKEVSRIGRKEKVFFFEKKKQKTFDFLAPSWSNSELK
jgi:hypothetical protein